MSDSLQKLVDARDVAQTRDRLLGRLSREPVSRRVCKDCWHVCLDKKFTPGLQTCPMCGGRLHEVLL
jgi:hypothetical protein